APRSSGRCPLCGHDGCFGLLPGSSDRWFCWSTAHERDGAGVGIRSGRGFHGDVLDIDAHAAKCSRVELLRRRGYLAGDAHRKGTQHPGAPQATLNGDFADQNTPPGPISELLSIEQVLALSDPSWVLPGLTPELGLVVVAGPP